MHPIIFEFSTPKFLQGLFPDTITLYAYGTMIALGALLGFMYTAYEAKKQFGLPVYKTQQLVLLIIVAAVIGGKLFIIFEDPDRYLGEPGALLRDFGNGFVFYGSLLFAIPAMLLFFSVNRLPVLPMLDIVAILTCIVHGFGRMGCFFAGCCYGVPTDGPLGVVCTDPHTQADPMHTPLHPTQLYSVGLIAVIALTLLQIKRRKRFHGQLFVVYLLMYSAGRSVIEVFRGDLSRGYAIGDIVTNAQLVSFLIFAAAAYAYFRLGKDPRHRVRKAPA
jgi:phosphatidylglycerol:prolipoprotein diacylglycerol transferase